MYSFFWFIIALILVIVLFQYIIAVVLTVVGLAAVFYVLSWLAKAIFGR